MGSTEDKEAEAEMQFMYENSRMKSYAAHGDNLQRILRR